MGRVRGVATTVSRRSNRGYFKMSLVRTLALTAALLTSAAAPAVAQSTGGTPTYGSVSLTSGFPNDPYNVSVVSGGTVNAAQTLGGACVGFIANAPDFNLYWTAGSGSLPLYISAASSADTTLVINTPDGNWYCTDDGGNTGLNPGLRITNPQSGLYNIWVGTYGNASNNAATLSISELTSH